MDGTGVQAVALVLAGFVSGMFSGALGIGGSAVATPLIRLLGATPYLAVGTPVPMILPSTITGAITYLRAGLVDKHAVLWTAPWAAVFAFGGATATRLVPGPGLMLLSAGLLLGLAYQVAPKTDGSLAAPAVLRPGRTVFAGLGIVTGSLSGLLGVGGGFLMVPVFIRLFAMPVKRSVGTSLAIIALTTPPNIAGHSLAGNIDWRAAVLLALGVVPGARTGALLAMRTSDRWLRRLMAATLALFALAYAGGELVKIYRA